jgi:NitT/TauT family transport system substrate-binding protein
MKKRTGWIALAFCCAIGASQQAGAAETVEKPDISIGTASLGLTYLPLIIADHQGYFKDAGVNVEISAYPGGSKALEALMGGSVDVVSGAYSNTLTMAAKGQKLVEFVDQVRCPGFLLAVSKARSGQFHGMRDLKGMRVGVSAPGSSTHMVVNYILQQAGLQGSDVSVIGVGSSAGAVAAIQTGQIDALIDNDPAMTMVEKGGYGKGVLNMRSQTESDRVFGGPYPEASFYTRADFIAKNPKTVQAITNAVVRAERWLQTATPEQVADAVPPEYLLGDRALYLKAFTNMRTCLSPDGMLTHDAAATVLKVLAAFDDNVKNADIKLETTYDNRFVQHALQAPQ